MSDTHESVIQSYYDDAFRTGRTDSAAIDRYMAADFVAHDLPLAQAGCDDYKRFISMFAASFSDMQHIVHDMFGCDNKVVARWTWSGIHTAEFMGNPASNRQITVKGIDIFNLREGRIADLWQEIDILGVLRQISAPSPDATNGEAKMS